MAEPARFVAEPARDRRPLSERWRPTRLEELVGNPQACRALGAWAAAWEGPRPPARRAALLVGPPGVGKTTAAAALAAEHGWTLVEMNASDARNEGAIERIAGRASITHPLDAAPGGRPSSRALVLLDEADCLSGRATERPRAAREPIALRPFLEGRYGTIEALNRAWGLDGGGKLRPFEGWASVPRSPGNAGWARLPSARKDLEDWRAAGRAEETGDRGGLAAIARLVRTTLQPLVLTVNDDRTLTRYSAVFRTAVARIRFEPVAPSAVAGRLRTVAAGEGIRLAPETVSTIVERSQGDLRAALNDLDAIAPLPTGRAQLELLGVRDRESDFAGFTEEVLSTARFYRSGEVRDRLDAPPDDLLPWIEENAPWFAVDAVHRDAAMATVAVAERMLGRARRWRTYGLWSYATELLSGGVGLAVRDRPAPSGAYVTFPKFLGDMGRSRAARAVRDAVGRKLGRHLHISQVKVRSTALPFVEGLLASRPGDSGSRAAGPGVVAELQLTPEEVGLLLGEPPDSPAVERLLARGGPEVAAEEGEEEAPGTTRPSGEGSPARPKARVQRKLGEFARG